MKTAPRVAFHFSMAAYSDTIVDFSSSEFHLQIRVVLDHFMPQFFHSASEELIVQQVSGGITNQIFIVTAAVSTNKVVVRLFGRGSDKFIERSVENIIFSHMSSTGVGPQLIGIFGNGRLESYVYGQPVEIAELFDEKIFSLVARNMCKFHLHDADIRRDCVANNILTTFLGLVKDMVVPEGSIAQTRLGDIKQFFDFEAEALWYIDFLAAQSATVLSASENTFFSAGRSFGLEQVLCHNDLLSGNILRSFPEAESLAITFIDYEYAGYNHRAFDLANHLLEFCGNDCDFSRCPDDSFRRRFMLEYLQEYPVDRLSRSLEAARLPPSGLDLSNPADEAVSQFMAGFNDSVKLLEMAALLMWSGWGLYQGVVSDIDFDFLTYSTLRAQHYLDVKSKYLTKV